jgi:hypothetical protein
LSSVPVRTHLQAFLPTSSDEHNEGGSNRTTNRHTDRQTETVASPHGIFWLCTYIPPPTARKLSLRFHQNQNISYRKKCGVLVRTVTDPSHSLVSLIREENVYARVVEGNLKASMQIRPMPAAVEERNRTRNHAREREKG